MAICLLAGCNNEEVLDVQVHDETEQVSKRDRGCPYYGIDITDYWDTIKTEYSSTYDEVSQKMLEDGRAVVQICVVSWEYTTAPAFNASELGFRPFEDLGWRIYLDGSSGQRMYLTHREMKKNRDGGFSFPSVAYTYTGYYTIGINESNDIPYYTVLDGKFGPYVNRSYLIYVYIGVDYDEISGSYKLRYRSHGIPVGGDLSIISYDSLPLGERLFPNLE